jgi:hypothetical protein
LALLLSETLKTMMADTLEVMDKRYEKRHRKKEATASTFIDRTKQGIPV